MKAETKKTDESMTWTPGPWKTYFESCHSEACDITAADDSNHAIAITCPQRDDGVEIANARLISCAPELFDALDAVVQWGNRHDGPMAWEVLSQARAALNKAAGVSD